MFLNKNLCQGLAEWNHISLQKNCEGVVGSTNWLVDLESFVLNVVTHNFRQNLTLSLFKIRKYMKFLNGKTQTHT